MTGVGQHKSQKAKFCFGTHAHKDTDGAKSVVKKNPSSELKEAKDLTLCQDVDITPEQTSTKKVNRQPNQVTKDDESLKKLDSGVNSESSKLKEETTVHATKEEQKKYHFEVVCKNSKLKHDVYLYKFHRCEETLSEGFASGKYLSGVLQIKPSNSERGYVAVDGMERDIVIDGDQNLNRALDGDLVALKIINNAKKNRSNLDAKPVAGLAQKKANDPLPDIEGRVEGKVVAILQKCARTYVGTFRIMNGYVLFYAKDSRLPRGIEMIDCPKLDKLDKGDVDKVYLVVKLVKWRVTQSVPMAELVDIINKSTMVSIPPEIEAIITDCGLSEHLCPLSEKVDASLPQSTWQIPKHEISKRTNFKDKVIFSIDPWDAKDIDDAISISHISDDVFEIGVHIADVSHFVSEGSPVDAVAKQRCTSVYLVQEVLPMLPPVLSEELCSLKPNCDRLAFSVTWRMRSDGTIVDNAKVLYEKSIVRSVCQLDYKTAQTLIDKPLSDTTYSEKEWPNERRPKVAALLHKVHQSIHQLWTIAKARRQKRLDDGAMSFSGLELKFSFDPTTNEPNSVSTRVKRESNDLIEEFMLLTNYLVAKKLTQHQNQSALLRCHPAPDFSRYHRVFNPFFSVKMDRDKRFPLNACLDKILETRGFMVYNFVMMQLKRSSRLAEYKIISRSVSEADKHYALNMPYYTHFTSPIRRYADVLTHRLLSACLDGTTKVDLNAAVVDRCNQQKANAKLAEHQCDRLFLAKYLMHRPRETKALVVTVGLKFIPVFLSEFGLEQRVHFSDIGATATMKQGVLTVRRNHDSIEFKQHASITVKVWGESLTTLKIDIVF